MTSRIILIAGLALVVCSSASAIDKARLRWARSKPAIDSIAIEGNQSFSYSDIRKRLYSRPRNLWLAIKGDRRSRVQRETRGRDTLEVKYLYLTNGFLSVGVDHSYEPVAKDSSALVKIRIDEGRQYLYGPRRLIGLSDTPFRPRVLSLIERLEPGEPVNVFDLKQTETDIKTFLANRGYPYAQVGLRVDTTSEPENCAVTFEVHADSLVHFGQVAVTGAKRYPAAVGLRELKITPGAIYRREDILESQRRLFESGFYTTFQLVQAGSSQDRLNPDFVLEVRERKSHYITLRTGAAQSEVRDLQWDISTGIGSRNSFNLFQGASWLTAPKRFEFLADYSFEAGTDPQFLDHSYRARLTEPWFLGTRTKMTMTWEWEPTLTDPVTGEFDKRSWSISTAFTKWFGRKFRADLGGEYLNINISGIPEDQIALKKEQEGNSARRKLYLYLRRDSRDDLFIPRRGSVTEFSGDFYGGFLRGDADFFKLQGSWSRYRLVWPGWISASRIKGAWAEEFGQTVTVPLDEAIYLGGANTVRGFEENTLGPLDPDGITPAGARYTLVFNQEFRFPSPFQKIYEALPFAGGLFRKFPVWNSIFVDVGNGFRNKEEIRFDNLAIAYGIGFQIASPAGPIRIDYAEVLEHHNFDFAHRWHFTILYAF